MNKGSSQPHCFWKATQVGFGKGHDSASPYSHRASLCFKVCMSLRNTVSPIRRVFPLPCIKRSPAKLTIVSYRSAYFVSLMNSELSKVNCGWGFLCVGCKDVRQMNNLRRCCCFANAVVMHSVWNLRLLRRREFCHTTSSTPRALAHASPESPESPDLVWKFHSFSTTSYKLSRRGNPFWLLRADSRNMHLFV